MTPAEQAVIDAARESHRLGRITEGLHNALCRLNAGTDLGQAVIDAAVELAEARREYRDAQSADQTDVSPQQARLHNANNSLDAAVERYKEGRRG